MPACHVRCWARCLFISNMVACVEAAAEPSMRMPRKPAVPAIPEVPTSKLTNKAAPAPGPAKPKPRPVFEQPDLWAAFTGNWLPAEQPPQPTPSPKAPRRRRAKPA
jgi:hypothetical protein